MSWRNRVESAKVRGRFLDGDFRAVSQWHSCAVGEGITKIRGRKLIGTPRNQHLARLGQDFLDAVSYDRGDAVEIFSQIQLFLALDEIGFIGYE